MTVTRCRCGKWTNYGMTCASCRISFSILSSDGTEEEEEVIEEEPLDEESEDED